MAVMANQMMIGLFGHIRGDQVKRDTQGKWAARTSEFN